MKKIDKWMYRLGMVVIFLALFFSLLALYYLFCPMTAIEVKAHQLPVIGKEFTPGSIVQYEIDYCKYIDAPARVSRFLIDTIILSSEEVTSNMPIGCHKVVASFILPPWIPKDEYKIVTSMEYKVNPLRTLNYRFETETFIVK